jgi:DNA polymerase III delta prime subunit
MADRYSSPFQNTGAPTFANREKAVQNESRRDLLILLKKVRQFWIQGVLEYSIHNEMFITLGKEKMIDVVEHPWETVLELPDQTTEDVSPEKTISAVFEEVGRFLLILGEPGSGKTITLLELARDLLNSSESDSVQPIPVIFNLSSWMDKDQSIRDWIISELKAKYQIPDKMGESWMESHGLLVLLDGLDEVRPGLQGDCVKAINRFITDSPFGLVVCCRLAEYMSLGERLKLNAAICLQHLTTDQIDEYFDNAGPELSELRSAVENDPGLQTLVQTPLMLSIMCLAYKGQSVEELGTGSGTTEEQRTRIFNTYIERMFERKGKSSQWYSKEKVIRRLSWLGTRMQAHSQTVFLVENLQPDWLAPRSHLLAYLLITRLMAGIFLTIGLDLPFMIGPLLFPEDGPISVLVHMPKMIFLVISVLTPLTLDFIWYSEDEKLDKLSHRLFKKAGFRFIICLIISSLLFTVSYLFSGDVRGFSLGIHGLDLILWILGITAIQWVTFGTIEPNEKPLNEIITIELLQWSWIGAIKSSLRTVCAISITLLAVVNIVSYFQNRDRIEWLRRDVKNTERQIQDSGFGSDRETLIEPNDKTRQAIVNLNLKQAQLSKFEDTSIFDNLMNSAGPVIFISLLLGIPIGLMLGGVKSKLTERKTFINQGIILSIRNAVVSGTVLGAVSGISVGLLLLLCSYLTDWRFGPFYSSFVIGVIIGFLIGFRLGGFTLIKHYCLRAFLFADGKIPLNFSHFLNNCNKLIFLQRVGGGYIFIHRLLLEHFASLYESKKAVDN